jgi:Nucleoside-diphosphate-sugar epimerases
MHNHRKILVTGGAGFIGSHIVDSLVADSFEVFVIDRAVPKYPNPNAEYILMDLNSEKLDSSVASILPDCVIHLAAQTSVGYSVGHPLDDARDNVLATLKLLDSCKKHSVKKIMATSSAAVYGNPEYLPIDEKHPLSPLSPYAITKIAMENYIKISGLDYNIFRCSNVYGPRQDPYGEAGVISIFVERILCDSELFIYGDGDQVRDFIFVGDIAAAFVKAVNAEGCGTFNLSKNSETTVNELFKNLADLSGYARSAVYTPAKEGDIKVSVLDNSNLVNFLNYKPSTNLSEGLKITWDFFKNAKQ